MADDLTLQLIRAKEGFRAKAYYDKTAYRVGYGSDTWTDENGKVHRVTKGTTITREMAEADLQRRVPEFQRDGVIRYVGQDAWDAMSPQAKAAVTSLAYNYGSLNGLPSLVRAIQSGDDAEISQAILNRAGDNNGENKKRRTEEAVLVAGHPIPHADIPGSAQKGFEYTKAGKPIDPENRFLMETDDPRYARAMAAKTAGTSAIPATPNALTQVIRNLDTPPPAPRPRLQGAIARIGLEPPPPASNSFRGRFPTEVDERAALADRIAATEPAIAQSETPLPRRRPAAAVSNASMGPLELPMPPPAGTTRSPALAAALARYNAAKGTAPTGGSRRGAPKAETATAALPKPGVLSDEYTKPRKKSGVIRTAGGIAGTVQLPAGVRPNVNVPQPVASTTPQGPRGRGGRRGRSVAPVVAPTPAALRPGSRVNALVAPTPLPRRTVAALSAPSPSRIRAERLAEIRQREAARRESGRRVYNFETNAWESRERRERSSSRESTRRDPSSYESLSSSND